MVCQTTIIRPPQKNTTFFIKMAYINFSKFIYRLKDRQKDHAPLVTLPAWQDTCVSVDTRGEKPAAIHFPSRQLMRNLLVQNILHRQPPKDNLKNKK